MPFTAWEADTWIGRGETLASSEWEALAGGDTRVWAQQNSDPKKQTNKKLASPKFEYVIESKYLQLPCLWYIDFEIGNKFYDYLQSHLNLKLSFSLGLERKLQWEPKTHSYQQHEY